MSESAASDRKLAITGTPGTGKTTVTELLDEEFDVIHLNDVIESEGLWTERDEERDSVVADFEAIEEYLGDWSGVLESHLAHHFDADAIVVLRCHPDDLEDRLLARGETAEKASENAESEALDVILSESASRHGADAVYEIDTTNRDPDAVAADVRAVDAGEREPSAGTVDFTGYL